MPENTPITLSAETKVAAEATGGTALGVVTSAAVLYPIITKAIAASKPEPRVVPELSAVANPLQKPALLEKAVLEVEEADPALDSTVKEAIGPVLAALHRLPPAPCLNTSCDSAAEKELIEGLSVAAEDPALTTGEVDVVNELRDNVKVEALGLAEQEFGSSLPADLPPLPPDLSPSTKFVKDPEAQAAAPVTQTITEIEQENVVVAEQDPAFAQVMDEIDHEVVDPSLPSAASTPQELVDYAQTNPSVGALSQDIGTAPQDPIKVTPSGNIETTAGALEKLSNEADQQATEITKQTESNVKEELCSCGAITPQEVLADETKTLGPELERDSVAAELPEELLKDGTAGAGVSSAATGALGAAKIIGSDVDEEIAAAAQVGAVNGAKAAIDAGEASASLVSPLMLVQLATQLPQIITQIVQLIKGEPNFEQQVLSALTSIKEQIGALSEQVTHGLNYVDETLRGVGIKIEQDTQLLEHVAANGNQLQSDLAEITGKLDQIQATLYRIAESAREETLNTALNTYMGYGQRFGGELPLTEFAKAVGVFFTWGDESSLNAVSEHQGGSTSPNQVATELQGAEGVNALNENLDYLASFADKAGWLDGLPVINPAVPNPEVWATASNAYSQLLLENTSDVTKGVRSSIGELESVGDTLQPFIREITEKGSSYAPMEVDGVKIDTGSSILNHALANYLATAVAPSAGSGMEPSLDNRIQAQQNAALAAQPAGAADESFGHCSTCTLASAPTGERGNTGQAFINPWAGADQTPSGHMPALAATSDPEQKNSGGVSHLAEMNLCKSHAVAGFNGEANSEATGLAWLEKFMFRRPTGEEQQKDALLVPLGSFQGQEVLPNNLDPLPVMFANAWHLGFGRLISCYAPEFSGTGIKLQVMYMWEWPGHTTYGHEVLLRITLFNPLPKASGCFASPTEGVRDLWNFEVEAEKIKKGEGHTCWNEEVVGSHNEFEEQLGKLTSYVKSHVTSWPEVRTFEPLLNNEVCKKETGDLFECEVQVGGQPFIFDEALGNAPLGKEVSNRLLQLRQDLNKHVAEPNASESLNEEAPADVQEAAVRVNGARALLDDYIELGMPNAMTQDPKLRDFVLGAGANLANLEKSGDRLLDNSPGTPNIFSVFTRELGEIEAGHRPTILWPSAFPQESCLAGCPAEVGLEEHANPVSEQVIEEPKKRRSEHDGVLPFVFKRSTELVARAIHADLNTEATAAVAEEPMVEAAAAELGLARDLVSIAPVNRKAPEVQGSPAAGEPLNCSPGSWEARPAPTFTYSWLRNGASVGSGPTYVVANGDVGQELACEVTAANREGESESAMSGSVTVGATPPQASNAVLAFGAPVPKPDLTIEMAQRLKGSKAGFRMRELTVPLGRRGVAAGRRKLHHGRRPSGHGHQTTQIIEYQITVRNTGNVPLTVTNLSDPYCARIASGRPPGAPLQPGSSALYSCQQVVSRDGTYLNQATIEATPPFGDGFAISRTSNETVALGPDPEPTAETGDAIEVRQNSALVAGRVNPHGRKVTRCTFEYWTTDAIHGAKCAKSPGHGTTLVKVTARIENLSPATTYHYRIAAGNPTGTSRGNAREFTTPAAPEAITQTATGAG